MSDVTSTSSNEEVKSSRGPFRFRFTIFEVVTEERDRLLCVKLGLKVNVVNLDHIRYLYYRDLRDQEMSEITVAQGTDDHLKRVRLYADLKAPGFHDLWRYLVEQNPEADISSLPLREAYTLMGSRNQPWRALAAVMGVAIFLIAIFELPLLFHAFDRGRDMLSVDRTYLSKRSAYQVSSKSSNVVFSGEVDVERAWVKTGRGSPFAVSTSQEDQAHLSAGAKLSRRGEMTREEIKELEVIAPLYPLSLVSDSAPSYPPARLLVLARGKVASDLLRQPRLEGREGVTRTIWWEGLGSHARAALIKRGVELDSQLTLIELGKIDKQRQDDLIVYLSSIGVLALMAFAITLYLKPATPSS